MRKWLPLLAVCLGTFMLLVDVTIVNVALPSMAVALNSSFTFLQWVIDGYALALAALLMVAGAIADRHGRRGAYVVGLVVFAAASAVCGCAPNPVVLVAARLVQGVGGAAMFASATALLQSSYTGRDRGTAFGIWGAVSAASAAAGPILGGVLTESISWRAIFWVNLPVAVAAVALSLRALPADRPVRHPAGAVDVPGGIAFTVAVAGVVFALISGGEHGWTGARPLSALAVAVVALVAFLLIERRAARPLLDPRLWRSPSFAVLMVTALIMQAAAFGHLAYVSIWLQSLLGLSPIRAGLVVLPLSVASFAVSAGVGRLLHNTSPRLPVGLGMLLIGIGVLLMRLVGPGSGWTALLPGLVVLGAGVGLGTPVLVSATMATVPARRAGMAAGAVNTFRQLGMAVGIAVLGTVYSARMADVVRANPAVPQPDAVAAGLSRGGAASILSAVPVSVRSEFAALAHAAFAAGLDRAFLVAGGAAVLCGLLVLAVVRAPAEPEAEPGPSTPALAEQPA